MAFAAFVLLARNLLEQRAFISLCFLCPSAFSIFICIRESKQTAGTSGYALTFHLKYAEVSLVLSNVDVYAPCQQFL